MDLGLPPVVAILTANTTEFMAKMGEAGAAMGGLEEEGGGKLQTLGKVGGLAFAAIGVAAVAVGAYSIDAASKFDSAMETIHTQAGASQSEVDKMKSAVLGLAGSTAEAPMALADALYHIESNGIRGATALGILKVAAEGAQVGHADLTDTTNALTAAINSGIPGVQNFGQAMGALNAIVGSGDMKMQDLNDAFGTGIVVIAKQFGNSLNDVGSALATFGDNNIRGAKAGTELKMAIMDLAQQSKPGQAELAKFGIKAGELADDMRKGGLGAALVDLKDKLAKAGVTGSAVGGVLTEAFTKKAAAPLAILVDQLGRFQSKQEAIAQGSGKFGEDWTATTKTFAFQMKQLEATVQELAIRLGEWLIPKVEKVAEVVAAASRWLEKHQEVAKMLAIVVGGILVTAIAAYTVAMIGAIATTIIAAAPILAILAASALLAVGIYELATHWKQVWDGIKSVADDAWHVLDGAWQSIDKDVRHWFGDVEKFLKKWWPEILGVFTGGVGLVVGLVVQHWSQISAFTERIWHDITGFFSNMWRDVTGFARRIASDVSGFFQRMWDDVTGFAKRIWHDVTGFFQRMWGDLWNIAAAIHRDIVGFFKRMSDDVSRAVSKGVGDVVDFFKGLPDKIWKALGSLADDFYKFGAHIIQRMIDGVGSMAGKVGSSIGNTIKSGINSIPGVGSLASAIGLAEGGKVTKPTLAIIGEGGESEFVIPESWFRGSELTSSGVQPLASALGVGGQAAPSVSTSTTVQMPGGGGDLVLQMNSQELVRVAGNDIWTWLLTKNRQTTLGFK
jgi:TP901 family phage tail tape measure protein